MMFTSPHKKGLLLFFVLLLLLGLGAFALTMNDAAPLTPGAGVSRQETLSGSFTCLPHRDTGGPTTLECAFGIRTDDGSHYALDMGGLQNMPPDWSTQERITVTGLLVPIEAISSDQWRKYDIRGIMHVTEIDQD